MMARNSAGVDYSSRPDDAHIFADGNLFLHNPNCRAYVEDYSIRHSSPWAASTSTTGGDAAVLAGGWSSADPV